MGPLGKYPLAAYARKAKVQHEDAAHKGKNHENKTSWGPLKVWEPQGSIPCSLSTPLPPQLSVGLAYSAPEQESQLCSF